MFATKCHDMPNRNAPSLRWNSCCITVTVTKERKAYFNWGTGTF